MRNKILSLAAAFLLLCSIPLTVCAHDVPLERNDCSITLTVRYDGENITGGTLTAIKVGYVDEKNGNFFFSQEMTGIPLEDITSTAAPGIQEEFYNSNKDNFAFYTQTQPVQDGSVTFSGLSTGLYLIVQEKTADGFSRIGAFLISIPYMEDGVYQYHVKASIKSEVEREPEPTEPEPTEPTDPWLPQTGPLNWPIPLMVVAGLGFFAVGWALCFGKKREQYEK